MKKIYFVLTFVLCTMIFGQKRKGLEVYNSVETNVKVMKSFGDNSFNKVMNPFFGFGFGLNIHTNKKFGIAGEINLLKSNVKVEKQMVYGNLGDPRMFNVEISAFHEDKLSESFILEELVGMSTYRIKSDYLYQSGKFTEGNTGFHIGGKLIYTLDREEHQKFVLGLKLNYYNGKIYNENPDLERFFSRAIFAYVNLGYRYSF